MMVAIGRGDKDWIIDLCLVDGRHSVRRDTLEVWRCRNNIFTGDGVLHVGNVVCGLPWFTESPRGHVGWWRRIL